MSHDNSGIAVVVLYVLLCRLSRTDRGGLSAVDYDEHILPGEAVLLNGDQSSNKPVALLPATKDDTTTCTTSLYGCSRLNCTQQQQQHVVAVSDCPTCRDTHGTSCNVVAADDSEVCFTEELVRRKLLLGHCPSSLLHVTESQYDTVPMPSGGAEVQVMRTFKGLPQQTAASSCCRTSLHARSTDDGCGTAH